MAAEARVSSIWKKQKLFIALFFLGVGFYFLFDGLIGYPRKNERWQAHEEQVKAHGEKGWKAYADSRGWSSTPPHKFYTKTDIISQYVFAGITASVGALLLIYWITQKDRRLRTDAEAVYTPTGTRVPFSSIIGLGKKKWESKGLATVRYEEQGRHRQFIVDDYKFEAEAAKQILTEIEEHLLARSGAVVTNAPPPEG
jgi:hypothetical protein